MVPEKLLSSRYSDCKVVKLSRTLKLPVIALLSMESTVRLVKEARAVGRELVIRLAVKLSNFKDDHCPIQLGIVPESLDPLASKKVI